MGVGIKGRKGKEGGAGRASVGWKKGDKEGKGETDAVDRKLNDILRAWGKRRQERVEEMEEGGRGKGEKDDDAPTAGPGDRGLSELSGRLELTFDGSDV